MDLTHKTAALFLSGLLATSVAVAGDTDMGYSVPAIVENGDTMAFEVLPRVTIFPNPYDSYTSERKRRLFWKTVRDVKRTYPYAVEIAAEVSRIDSATRHMTEAQKKIYMAETENDLVARFKPELIKLSYRQGKLLIKLVDRQCHRTSYELIKEYRGSMRAFFWQGFACMFGASLKKDYDPEENEVIETVISLVESGQV